MIIEDRTFDIVIEDSLWVDNLDVVALVGSKMLTTSF